MLGLRVKLLLGFGGLLFILLGVSLLGNTVLDYYSDATHRMLREDLDGIEASQRITDAVESIDDGLRWIAHGGVGGLSGVLSALGAADDDVDAAGAAGGPAANGSASRGASRGASRDASRDVAGDAAGDPARDPYLSDARRRAVLAEIRSQADRVDENLRQQSAGQTLPQERDVTAQLTVLWDRYRSGYAPLVDPASALTPVQRRELYTQALALQAEKIKEAAGEIYSINVNNMRSGQGEASATARSAQFAMHALTLCGAVLASGYALLLGRIIVRPIKTLTESVQQVRQGNLDLEVPVRSQDELGRLAQAFNEMASQLRVFRRIDHEKLIRSQRTTQLAIDSLPDAVVVINPQGGVELTNETAKRLFGLHPGVPVDSLPDKRLAELHRRAWRDGNRDGNGAPGGASVTGPAANGYGSSIKVDDAGRDRFFLPRSVPIVDEQRNTVGLTIVLADVTDFRRLDEMKNGLLSTVSHELKTPLTSMRMILHLVVEEKVGPLTTRQRELLVAAREDSDRLHQIIENLLDMGRIESGMAFMETRPTDPAELVWSCVEPMRPGFAAKGVALRFDPPTEPTPPVLADRNRVGHVFNNLLGNALRYTPTGGTVRVGLRQALDGVEFTVSDTGPGIPHEFLHRVFEKFFRVPGQPGESGAGLGLAIVKDVVEAHGGAVTVESPPGQGTTFRFTLRLAHENATEAGATGAAGGNGKSNGSGRAPDGDAGRPGQRGRQEMITHENGNNVPAAAGG